MFASIPSIGQHSRFVFAQSECVAQFADAKREIPAIERTDRCRSANGISTSGNFCQRSKQYHYQYGHHAPNAITNSIAPKWTGDSTAENLPCNQFNGHSGWCNLFHLLRLQSKCQHLLGDANSIQVTKMGAFDSSNTLNHCCLAARKTTKKWSPMPSIKWIRK